MITPSEQPVPERPNCSNDPVDETAPGMADNNIEQADYYEAKLKAERRAATIARAAARCMALSVPKMLTAEGVESRKKGQHGGQEWALCYATATHLKRLTNEVGDCALTFSEIGEGYYEILSILFFEDMPVGATHYGIEANHFYYCWFGTHDDNQPARDKHFVRGFVEGALEMWWSIQAAM